MTLQTFTEEIAQYMKRNHLKQSSFAQLMHVSNSSVSLWLRQRRRPNAQNYLQFDTLLKEEYENGTTRT